MNVYSMSSVSHNSVTSVPYLSFVVVEKKLKFEIESL